MSLSGYVVIIFNGMMTARQKRSYFINLFILFSLMQKYQYYLTAGIILKGTTTRIMMQS